MSDRYDEVAQQIIERLGGNQWRDMVSAILREAFPESAPNYEHTLTDGRTADQALNDLYVDESAPPQAAKDARELAWAECRADREPVTGSDDWTVGEVGTYRGFFYLGWEAARLAERGSTSRQYHRIINCRRLRNGGRRKWGRACYYASRNEGAATRPDCPPLLASEHRGQAMICPDCETEMDAHDTTYSNTGKQHPGINPQHTGAIYKCPNEDCGSLWLDNFITKQVARWNG
jgi:hypothetical protein